VSINDLLASGNIPDLYTAEEMDAIVNTGLQRISSGSITHH
jgi:hypothetical protein